MDKQHDVVFIILDSLRTDHVSTYDYDRETTPALDRFADTATRYENAYVPAPWTLPSHCSMFTGKTPAEHGITNGFTDRDLTLPTDHPTITQRLKNQGYRAAGFSNNPWVGKLSGLDRGFDRFVEWDLEVSRGKSQRRSDQVYNHLHTWVGRATQQPFGLLKRPFFTSNLVTRAKQWVHTDSDPTFTFLNLMEAHSPYYPPDWAFRDLGLEVPNFLSARLLNTKLLAYTAGKRSLSERDQRRVHEFLDASIRFQDRQLEILLNSLAEQNRYEDSLIVICADHGKTLGEFDREGKPPHYLRDINIRVPLFIKFPGQREETVVSNPVELANLADFLANPMLVNDYDPQCLVPDDGYALIEDYLPHTASESRDVEQWHAVTDGDSKLLRGPNNNEYVLRGNGTGETVIPESAIDDDNLRQFRNIHSERISQLSADTSRPEALDEQIDGRLKSQLEDLGYLN